MPLRMQTFDSNGPDVRIRGSAYQVHEKYLQLARDANSSGDRIMAESYLQHAEHYYRIIAAVQEQQNANDQNRRVREDGQGYAGQDYRGGQRGDEMNGEGGEDYGGEESGEGGGPQHRQDQGGYRQQPDQGYRQQPDGGRYQSNQDGPDEPYRQPDRQPDRQQYRSQGDESYRPQPEQNHRPREYNEQPEPVQEARAPQWEANGRSDEPERQEALFLDAEPASPQAAPRRGRPRRERPQPTPVEPMGDPEPSSEG